MENKRPPIVISTPILVPKIRLLRRFQKGIRIERIVMENLHIFNDDDSKIEILSKMFKLVKEKNLI